MEPASNPRTLGVCYYPEHWPADWWPKDARRMVELGLRYVRIGEFAWSRIEPEEGRFDWAWLDRALAVLGDAGLRVVLCTPTPTPPRWLTVANPQVLRHDENGLPVRHGSRRHVSVASATYRALSAAITRRLVERYGEHPAVAGWQTDNEFGCHESTLSYGAEDRAAFARWLSDRYGSVEALNEAWGNAFWSQEYPDFDAVDLPHRLQTDANPAHWMDFRRFFSDATIAFNAEQCAIIRAGSPGRFITHNAMMFEVGFDHWRLGQDLDFLSWDSYPLGFLRQLHERSPDRVGEDDARRFAHIGHPDIVAFHHDLYRAQSTQPFWVMEQQPGPVNWASHNPAPVDGAVASWTCEAFAHGASTVSYFRWRQAPWAQEQMHAGLLTPWDEPARAYEEVENLGPTLDRFDAASRSLDPAVTVGLYFDYESTWFFEALRQGADLDAQLWTFDWYRAARRLGLNVEFLGPHPGDAERLRDVRLVLFPTMPVARPDRLREILDGTSAHLVFGPRSGSRLETMAFDARAPRSEAAARPVLPPPYLTDGRSALLEGLDVLRVESLPPSSVVEVASGTNVPWAARGWVEHLRVDAGSELEVTNRFLPPAEPREGLGAAVVQGRRATYLGFQPDPDSMVSMLTGWAAAFGLEVSDLGPDLRRRRCDDADFWFNFGAVPAELPNGDVVPPWSTRLSARR